MSSCLNPAPPPLAPLRLLSRLLHRWTSRLSEFLPMTCLSSSFSLNKFHHRQVVDHFLLVMVCCTWYQWFLFFLCDSALVGCMFLFIAPLFFISLLLETADPHFLLSSCPKGLKCDYNLNGKHTLTTAVSQSSSLLSQLWKQIAWSRSYNSSLPCYFNDRSAEWSFTDFNSYIYIFFFNDWDASENALFMAVWTGIVASGNLRAQWETGTAAFKRHLDFSLCREVHRVLSSKACGKMWNQFRGEWNGPVALIQSLTIWQHHTDTHAHAHACNRTPLHSRSGGS